MLARLVLYMAPVLVLAILPSLNSFSQIVTACSYELMDVNARILPLVLKNTKGHLRSSAHLVEGCQNPFRRS